MNWIVFGDDWAAHPSTTQYLIANLPADDYVVWIDSIGMRSPRLAAADMWRSAQKLYSMVRSTSTQHLPNRLRCRPKLVRISPKVVPFHLNTMAQAFNRHMLRRAISQALGETMIREAVLLLSNPAGVWYLPDHYRSLVYLRLDDYSLLPGADETLVRSSEARLYDVCDAVVVTAKLLMPDLARKVPMIWIPQGVDLDHFSCVPLQPPRRKVLGFFGLLAEWIDFDLIHEVARSCPDWTLELLGPIRYLPDTIRNCANIRIRQSVPYNQLPHQIGHWDAAWIPFKVNRLTQGVNPLKLREYLAAGLPVVSTRLPEVTSLCDSLYIVDNVEHVQQALHEIIQHDSPESRSARRELVRCDGWERRACELRRVVTND